jgi:hypothetical protein
MEMDEEISESRVVVGRDRVAQCVRGVNGAREQCRRDGDAKWDESGHLEHTSVCAAQSSRLF